MRMTLYHLDSFPGIFFIKFYGCAILNEKVIRTADVNIGKLLDKEDSKTTDHSTNILSFFFVWYQL